MSIPMDTQHSSDTIVNTANQSWGSQFSGLVSPYQIPSTTNITTTVSVSQAAGQSMNNPIMATSTPFQPRQPFNLRAPTFVPATPVNTQRAPGYIIVREQTPITINPQGQIPSQQHNQPPMPQPAIATQHDDPNRALTITDLTNLQQHFDNQFQTHMVNVEKLVNATVQPIKNKLSSLETQNELLKEDVATLQVELKDLRFACNHNAQYSRRTTIRVLGIAENEGENCAEKVVQALVQHKVHNDLKATDVEIAHRVGRITSGNNSKPRHIIARLKFRGTKDIIMKNKKNLKGSNILVFEDLSPLNRQLLDYIKKSPEVESAWSSNGKIVGKLKTGSIQRFQISDMGL